VLGQRRAAAGISLPPFVVAATYSLGIVIAPVA
jgi:hypothetical protein